jgi:hypothetical protein
MKGTLAFINTRRRHALFRKRRLTPLAQDESVLITYTQLQFDAAQNLEGIFRSRMTVRLNRAQTEFNGSVTVEFFDLDGNLLFAGQGTIKGKRLPVIGADEP